MSTRMDSGKCQFLVIRKGKQGVYSGDDFYVDSTSANLQAIDDKTVYSNVSFDEFIAGSDFFNATPKSDISYVIYLEKGGLDNDKFISETINSLTKNNALSKDLNQLYLIYDEGEAFKTDSLNSNNYFTRILKAHGINRFSVNDTELHGRSSSDGQGSSQFRKMVLDVLYYYHADSILPDLKKTALQHPSSHSDFINQQLHTRGNLFDYPRIQAFNEYTFSGWSEGDFVKLTSNLIAIESLLLQSLEIEQESGRRVSTELAKNEDLLHSLHHTYSLLSEAYLSHVSSTGNMSNEQLYDQLELALHDFFANLHDFSTGVVDNHLYHSGFMQSALFDAIYSAINIQDANDTHTVSTQTVTTEETKLKPLFGNWMRAGQRSFSSTGGWLKQIGKDFIGRMGQELSNSLSAIQVLGYIQTKHYYEMSGEMTDDEKLDIQLQTVQLVELAETPITWAIDSVRYFTSSTKMMTVRFLSSMSDVISKAFFVFGAFFGVAVDAYSVSVSVKLLKTIKDPKARSGVIFGLITSVFSLVISVVTTIVIVYFVVTSIMASVATAGALVASAVVSGVMAGVSAATAAIGPIGLAVAALMMLASGIYTAVTTVERYKEKLNLSVGDQVVLGIRSFFMGIIPVADNFASPSVENRYQKIVTTERYLQMFLDYKEDYYTRLIESLAYGSDKLYRVAFSIDSVNLEVDQTYKRGAENGYESYKLKDDTTRDTVVNFDSYDFNKLKKNVNKDDVKTYQPDLPIPALSYTLDGNKGLYLMKFEGYRNLTRSPYSATVNPDPKDDVYKYLRDLDSYPVLLGDFDGNKSTDIVRFMDRGVHVNFNMGGFFRTWNHLYRGFAYYRGNYDNQTRHPRLVGDFNGDGFDDIVGFHDSHVEILINRRLKSRPSDEKNNLHFGFGGFSTIKFPSPLEAPKAKVASKEKPEDKKPAVAEEAPDKSGGEVLKDDLKTTSDPENNIDKSVFTIAGGYNDINSSPRFIGDFNCDKKDDIIGFSGKTMVQAYSTTDVNSFNAEFSLSDQHRFSTFKDHAWDKVNVLVGDYDGDGCNDLVGLKPEQMIVTFGNKPDTKAIKATHESEKYSDYFEKSYFKVALDITNDKKDDILFVNKDGSFGALISQGDGTFENLEMKEDWFKFPAQTTKVGKENQDYIYFSLENYTNTFIGKDHDNAAYIFRSNGQIVRHVLGPDTINGEDGILAIELGDGKDEARGRLNRSNHFYVGDGKKHFIGGMKDDKFILNTSKVKVPSVPSTLDGGPESLQPSSFRQPPIYEPIDTLTTYEENLNQNDYFVGNIIYISFDDARSGKEPGFEINLDQISGYAKYKKDDKKIAHLKNIEHATGHLLTGDHLIGDDGFNVLDGLGSIDSKNSDVLEGGGGNDLLIVHRNTFARGGPGDDRYIIKPSKHKTLMTISDTEGDNSVILSYDFDQVVRLAAASNKPEDLVLFFEDEDKIPLYLVLEQMLSNEDALAGLNFVTRDGFTIIIDSEASSSQLFQLQLNVSYSTKSDIKYASDIASSKGKIKVIQDLYHNKIQLVEMNDDMTDVIRVIRDIKLPDYCNLKPSSSDYNDETHGTVDNDLLNGGKGDDRLVGRSGEDFYVVTSSDDMTQSGITRINNFDPVAPDKLATDILRVDLSADEIKLIKKNSDLHIQDVSSNQHRQKDIIIENFFVSVSYQHLYLTDRNDYIFPVLIDEKNNPFFGPGTIKGTGGDDHKPDKDGYVKKLVGRNNARVTLFGMDGDDFLQAKASREDKAMAGLFDPSNRGDILLGGDGDDILLDSQGNDILKGEGGNDLIISTIGSDLIEPGGDVNHIMFLPGARGLKTYFFPADVDGTLENSQGNRILVPFDIDEAIYQRIGDDLQVFMTDDYEPLMTTDISDEDYGRIVEQSLILHVKDFFKSSYFRKFRISTYEAGSVKDTSGINRNLPNSLHILKEKDGIEFLESYREKSELNKAESSAVVPDRESTHHKVSQLQKEALHYCDDDEINTVSTYTVSNSLSNIANDSVLLVQAAAYVSSDIVTSDFNTTEAIMQPPSLFTFTRVS